MAKLKCHQCGTEVSKEAKFCQNCASPVLAMGANVNNEAVGSNRKQLFVKAGIWLIVIALFVSGIVFQKYIRSMVFLGAAASSDVDKGLELCKEAVRIDPTNSSAYIMMGNFLRKKHDCDQAISMYETAISISPQSDGAYAGCAAAYIGKYVIGNHDIGYSMSAVEYCKKAIQINPKSIDAYDYMGVAYVDMKEYPKAIESFEKAININPKFVDAYIHMALAYGSKNDIDMTIEVCEKAININPNIALAYTIEGAAYDSKGDIAQKNNCMIKAAKLGDQTAQEYLKTQGINWN